MSAKIEYTVIDRFFKYVKIDTQSDPHATTFPSTEKQKNLGKILVEELLALGLDDAHMDSNGYVYATLASTTTKDVPVICYCSHMDTSPDSSGKDVKPMIHENYDGRDLVLPDDNNQVLRMADHGELKNQIGNDIITASGLTLLGADDKAGIAEIMDAVHHLVNNPEIKHGTIRILFTPDEEIGRGVDYVDMEKLGAAFGYTVDGSTVGSIEDETFSADGVSIIIDGVSAHPGFAKGKLESALKIVGEIVAALPDDKLSPETTSGREGFIHPVRMTGTVEKAQVDFIIRSFVDEKLEEYEADLKDLAAKVVAKYPNSTMDFQVKEQYRNMKNILVEYPMVAKFAVEAIERSGLTAKASSIRGGTDGSRLSFMGLPCPNIFAGGHAFHSKQEWVAVQDMQKAVEVLINLAQIWEENGK